ncbi:MAG: glycosyltransferase family 4 protein [Pseudomonadota bacterium]
MAKTILVCSNYAWTLVNFRLSLLRALAADGYQVHVLTQFDGTENRLREIGMELHDLYIDRKGINPWRDTVTFFHILHLLKTLRPMGMMNFTIKPVIYGGLAARVLGIPYISTITGLGTAFINDTWLTRMVEVLYRVSQRRVRHVFFQNPDDRALFLRRRLVPESVTAVLPGSGVDLAWFEASPLLNRHETVFLLMARLLWDKGVGEYVEAARQVKARHSQARFQLLGFLGSENRTAISRETVEGWVAEGVVEYLGETDDVRPFIAAAHCVVLPSFYREGVPRSLLEAAAMGRPVITTDSVGCREAVEDGVNGYLCQVKDAGDLAEKMERFLALPLDVLVNMGRKGREKMEREFDERIVIDRYLAVIGEILN